MRRRNERNLDRRDGFNPAGGLQSHRNRVHRMTPEERESIELRMAELKARMDALDHLHNPANVPEWAALYEEREALEKQFGGD
jgi:hypothetical protein